MSIWEDSYPGPSPELGAGWPPENRNSEDVGCWLISCYVHNRFGEHGPSWEVLVVLIVKQGLWIREAADQVAYPHTLFGTDDASWEMFMAIYNGSQTVAEVADMVVAVEHA